jgi:uncharacterized protein YjbJ (UPF0337 family)
MKIALTNAATSNAGERRPSMSSGTADKATGRVKEAVGALIGDRRLKRQGKVDQAAGKAKDAAAKTIERVRRGLSD